MDYAAFEERHNERYRKILQREMTVEDALADSGRDWQAFTRTRDLSPTGNVSGDFMRNLRTGVVYTVEADGSLTPVEGIVRAAA